MQPLKNVFVSSRCVIPESLSRCMHHSVPARSCKILLGEYSSPFSFLASLHKEQSHSYRLALSSGIIPVGHLVFLCFHQTSNTQTTQAVDFSMFGGTRPLLATTSGDDDNWKRCFLRDLFFPRPTQAQALLFRYGDDGFHQEHPG